MARPELSQEGNFIQRHGRKILLAGALASGAGAVGGFLIASDKIEQIRDEQAITTDSARRGELAREFTNVSTAYLGVEIVLITSTGILASKALRRPEEV